MKNNDIFFVLIAFVFLGSTCKPKSEKDETIQPNEINTPKVDVPAFNVDSAYHFINKQVAFGPRVPNSKPHQDCSQFLLTELQKYADSVYVQSVDLKAYDGTILKSKNIIASFNPTISNRILLASHWDSRHVADQDSDKKLEAIDGANDGASGVGILLEVARILKSVPPTMGIDIILFDAEDYGQPDGDGEFVPDSYCLGSQYWSRNPHIKGYRADFGILLDMVGAPNATFTKEGTSMQFAPSYMNYVWDIATEIGHGSYFTHTQTGNLIDDHKYVNEIIKIPMIDIIHRTSSTMSGFGSYWHTHNDNMSMIDKSTLRAVGETVTHTIYRYQATLP